MAPLKRFPIPLFACVGAALLLSAFPTAARGEDRKVSAQELVKQGFFNDFDELDLGSLLEGTEVAVSVAGRRPEPLNQTSGPVTLVTAEEISSAGYRTLEDVLRRQPGFELLTDNLGRDRLVARGLPPQNRGRSEGVLLLMNGHRMNEPIDGGALAMNLALPVRGLHHIEILRGPASAVYGDGALAAVINLVTDSGSPKDREKNSFGVMGGMGNFGQEQAGFEVTSRVGEVWVGGLVQFLDSAGAELPLPADAQTRRDTGSGVPAISVAPGKIHDNNVRAIQTLYRIVYKDWRFLLSLKQERTDGYVGATDALPVQKNALDNRQLMLDALRTHKLAGGTLETRVHFTQSKGDQLLELIPEGFLRDAGNGTIYKLPSIFLQTSLGARRFGVESLYARSLPPTHDLTAGVSLEREATFGLSAQGNLDFKTFFPIAGLKPIPDAANDIGRSLVGFWVQDAWRAPQEVKVTAALRLDGMGGVGAQLSPRVSVVRALPHNLTARVVASRAWAAPTFRDLSFNLPGYTSNPDLEPETVRSFEGSLGYQSKDLELLGTFYLSAFRNSIEAAGLPSLARPTTIVNGPGANVRGIELTGRHSFGEHSVFLSWGLQSPRNAETGERSADVPTHVATFGGSWMARDHVEVTPTLRVRSSRPRAPGDPRKDLSGYGVFDVTVRYLAASKRLELRGLLSNLGGAHYFDPAPAFGVPGDYPRAGRGFFLDARYHF